MRADMGKVLVERPRPGSRDGSRPRKGYRKELRRALENEDASIDHEGIKRRYSNRRFFNEHLAPLRRFLNSRVGRPWSYVYSEICQHVDRGNVVQKHVLTHLFDYVATNTILIDGIPCMGERRWPYSFGQPIRDVRVYRDGWYVCPRSGLLKAFKKKLVKPYRWNNDAPDPVKFMRINETLGYVRKPNMILLVRLATLPLNWIQKQGYDALLKRRFGQLSEDAFQRTYGKLQYAVTCWQASQKELKQLPVTIE